ncbi:MAG: hypothetical protein LBV02_01680 [Bacteroidales bacterium]|nr:hypothetical protein [Bacteroidales bacterium]
MYCLNNSGFYEDFLTGYAGAVFMDVRDSTLIISHRATELAGFKSDIRDLAADAQIAGSNMLNKIITSIAKKFRPAEEVNEMLEIGLQYPSAKKLYEAVKQQFPENNIEQTGHSLGGSTTQLLAYEFGTKGVTFDPAGVGNKIYLDSAKRENIKNIVNYKVHKSLVSSSVTTGKNIGMVIEIYPIDEGKFSATKAHGLFEIYTQALNHETGYFKTFDEVARELWDNNGYISEIAISGILIPAKAQVKIQDKFQTYDEYKVYLKKTRNIKEQQKYNDDIEALNQNSVQFYLLDGKDTLNMRSNGSFILLDNTIEEGTYRIVEHKKKLYVLLNETDLLKITTESWFDKTEQTPGNYKFDDDDLKKEMKNEK